MTMVVDASLVVAAVLPDARGRWARECLGSPGLSAPHVLPVEVASSLRRHVLAGSVPASVGRDVLRDVDLLGLDLYPFAPFSDRVWELRDNLTAYDAWYVALAEGQNCPLATLDHRLVAAVGPRCEFVTPDG